MRRNGLKIRANVVARLSQFVTNRTEFGMNSFSAINITSKRENWTKFFDHFSPIIRAFRVKNLARDLLDSLRTMTQEAVSAGGIDNCGADQTFLDLLHESKRQPIAGHVFGQYSDAGFRA